MTATVLQARDEINTLAKAAFDAATLPTGFLVIWDDANPPTQTSQFPWARVSVRHNAGGQSTISGGLGKGRYERKGTVYVNLFCAPGDGLRVLDPLVKTVLDAYEGKSTPSQVWFRKARVREMGIVKGWYQINVLIDFVYEEIK